MMNSRTVSKISFLCDVFVTPFASYMERRNYIYQHLQDPTQEKRAGSSICTYLGAVTFSTAHLEFQGLIVIT